MVSLARDIGKKTLVPISCFLFLHRLSLTYCGIFLHQLNARDAKTSRKFGKDIYHKWIMIDVFAKFCSDLCITGMGYRAGEWRALAEEIFRWSQKWHCILHPQATSPTRNSWRRESRCWRRRSCWSRATWRSVSTTPRGPSGQASY